MHSQAFLAACCWGESVQSMQTQQRPRQRQQQLPQWSPPRRRPPCAFQTQTAAQTLCSAQTQLKPSVLALLGVKQCAWKLMWQGPLTHSVLAYSRLSNVCTCEHVWQSPAETVGACLTTKHQTHVHASTCGRAHAFSSLNRSSRFLFSRRSRSTRSCRSRHFVR